MGIIIPEEWLKKANNNKFKINWFITYSKDNIIRRRDLLLIAVYYRTKNYNIYYFIWYCMANQYILDARGL